MYQAMEEFRLKTGRAAEAAVRIYRKIEDSVVGAYRKIESRFVHRFLISEEK